MRPRSPVFDEELFPVRPGQGRLSITFHQAQCLVNNRQCELDLRIQRLQSRDRSTVTVTFPFLSLTHVLLSLLSGHLSVLFGKQWTF